MGSEGLLVFLAFFWLALRTLTFWVFYMNYDKEAKSLTFRRVSEVRQGRFLGLNMTPTRARIPIGSYPTSFLRHLLFYIR